MQEPAENTDSSADVSRHQWPGISFVIIATLVFACQDAISKILVAEYPVAFIVMVRYWAFLAAGLSFAATANGGLRGNIRSACPLLQCVRGVLLASQLLMVGMALRVMGVAEMTALYQAYPLFGAVFAAVILKEKVGWKRCLALGFGFTGILIMLRPGAGVFSDGAFYVLAAALIFALYMVLTRLAGRYDRPQTSFFYIGLVGSVILTAGWPLFQVKMAEKDIFWLAILCLTSVVGHFLMIKALSLAPVTVIQPFNYLQIVWSVIVGFLVFGAMPDSMTFLGAAIVVGSGLFVFYREQMQTAKIQVEAPAGQPLEENAALPDKSRKETKEPAG